MAIYLDNAATTKPCEAAVSAAIKMMTETYGNPSSLHKQGLAAELELVAARKIIADSLAVTPNELYFTSGASESTAALLRGLWQNFGKRKNGIITTTVEHPSVKETVNVLEKLGAKVTRVAPDKDGKFYPEDFAEATDDNTLLCTVMHVNNETGAIFPIKEIFGAVKRVNPGVITHTDAVQSYMKLPLKAADINADSITISAHKVHGIKGAGALYIKKGIRVAPLISGGGQERGFRSGTEAVPAIAAFGAAVKTLYPDTDKAYKRTEELNKNLRKRLSEFPFITINSPVDAIPYILNFSVRGIRSEIMLHFLESKGIYVSSGSACSKGKGSGVLTAFGVKDRDADEAIRVSFSRETVELEKLVAAICDGYESLQKNR
ncbi:MAG: cysteine desulfurase [Ruminococcus sp.]|jgi:cysteine desulfurase|nr:cysteine desulfurase [Ruminococcus sp.]